MFINLYIRLYYYKEIVLSITNLIIKKYIILLI